MKITFIKHSGFLIEWEKCVWLIDYYHGKIPSIDPRKKLLVFSSHKHTDHFNAKVFEKFAQFPQVEYILSDDIKSTVADLGATVTPKQLAQITYMKPHERQTFSDGGGGKVVVNTIASTDCGVAFLCEYQDQVVYHAGDLNCWVWEGESQAENDRMTIAYMDGLRTINSLTKKIDVAFVPLDPRQESECAKGILYFVKEVGARKIFPMHFWGKHEFVRQFLASEEAKDVKEQMVMVEAPGESWNL